MVVVCITFKKVWLKPYKEISHPCNNEFTSSFPSIKSPTCLPNISNNKDVCVAKYKCRNEANYSSKEESAK